MGNQLVYTRVVGKYLEGEVYNFIRTRTYTADGTRRGIIFSHANGLTADDQITDGTTPNFTEPGTGANADKIVALAEAGYPVLCADLGGPANWGAAACVNAMSLARQFLIDDCGAKADAVGLYGISMGALGALNWARTLPDPASSVFAIALGLPALDLVDLYGQLNGARFLALGQMYGVTYPEPIPIQTLADYSPSGPDGYGDSFDLAGVPIQVWASNGDEVAATFSECEAWPAAGATKVGVVDLTPTAHAGGAADISAQSVVKFFDDQGGRI